MPSPRSRARTKPKPVLARTVDVGAEPKGNPPAPNRVQRRDGEAESARTPGDEERIARVRGAFRIAPRDARVSTPPESLAEHAAESGGLLDLVPAVARRALDLGLRTHEPSFHVFVAAEPEVKVEDDVVRYATRVAATRPPPNDIVYVHDFDHPEAPRPLTLRSGAGPALVAAIDALIEELKTKIPATVDGDEFKRAQAELASELESKNRAVIHDLENVAKSLGFGVRPVHGGVQTFPMLHGKPVSAEQFDVLDDSTKRALSAAEAKLTREVDRAAQRVRVQGARFDAAREAAFSQAAAAIIAESVKSVAASLAALGDGVGVWLERVEHALVDDWEDLVESEEEGDEERGKPPREEKDDPELATRLNRFKCNLLVSTAADASAPVVYDTNPTYPNLFGYLERRARYGALLTDFTRIRPGSLHRASGGVLIVRAADLLADPIIWERFKRVLREQRIGAEDPLGPLGLYATSLRPVPVPIHVRVVLVGSHELHASLLDADPDFASLFRVKVEVDATIPRSPETLGLLDAHLTAMAKRRGWGHFDRGARAELLDVATRLAGDREKLTLGLSPLEETMAFAGARSAAKGADDVRVTADEVREAWAERRDRAGSAERHIREITLRGEVAVDTSGWRTGVVNGLSVFSTGDMEFGQPMRITAVVGIGREGLIDVERESQLGGSVHTKGVAILRGYLARMFGQERPLSLRAQLAFEQSYGEIDGDSASSSELFAVLSAIADVGLDQSVAVTGSVNQLGEMQAIGGLCAKIEGFFDLCNARGLTGKQGVLLPNSNRPHLVLREDVAAAVARGRFHLYGVDLATQGIEILTGLPAGERGADGRFPASSVFGRVERRIIEIAERLRDAEGHPRHDPSETLDDSPHGDGVDGSTASRR
jgi:predicted ATP-dependent protease